MTGKSVGSATIKFTAGDLSTTGTVSVTSDVNIAVDPFQAVLPAALLQITSKVTDRGGAPITPPGAIHLDPGIWQ
ncbi:MAG: hypothetical protein QM758_13985 [Armatimonas sp.]